MNSQHDQTGRHDQQNQAGAQGQQGNPPSGGRGFAGMDRERQREIASQGGPPAFLSDHPSNPDRLGQIAANIPRVQGLYNRAPKPEQRFGPPGSGGASGPG